MVTVHLRTLALPAPGDPHALLDPDEQARAARFRRDEDRAEFVAAHAVKRHLLAELLGADPRALRFRTDQPGGKPALDLPGGPELSFNLSHTAGMVACAAAFGAEVGLDVEPAGRRVEPDLAGRFFAPDEVRWLDGLGGEARDAGFIALWTLKEAVLKAVGQGLAVGLETFSVRPDPPRLLHHAGLIPAGRSCALRQWRARPHHLAALAVICGDGQEVQVVED